MGLVQFRRVAKQEADAVQADVDPEQAHVTTGSDLLGLDHARIVRIVAALGECHRERMPNPQVVIHALEGFTNGSSPGKHWLGNEHGGAGMGFAAVQHDRILFTYDAGH